MSRDSSSSTRRGGVGLRVLYWLFVVAGTPVLVSAQQGNAPAPKDAAAPSGTADCEKVQQALQAIAQKRRVSGKLAFDPTKDFPPDVTMKMFVDCVRNNQLRRVVAMPRRADSGQPATAPVRPSDLVGSWSKQGEQAVYLTFTDSTYTVPTVTARWHLSGDTLVADTVLHSSTNETPDHLRRVASLQGNELTLTDLRTGVARIYVRVGSAKTTPEK